MSLKHPPSKKKDDSSQHPINTTAEIEVTVVDIRGHCNFGYKLGDKIRFGSRCITGELCPEAMLTIWPKIYAIKHRTQFVWNPEFDESSVHLTTPCPDPYNPVWFEFRIIKPSKIPAKE